MACAPIACAPAGEHALRNKLELAIGRNVDGKVCVGFRLGLGGSALGEFLGPIADVPFVPRWMAAAAASLASALERGGHLAWKSLMLRGSEASSSGVAVLTRSEGAEGVETSHLCEALVTAARAEGVALVSVLVRGAGGAEEEALPGGSGGVLEERLGGLRLRISPGAFFQVCTGAAEVLLRAVADAVSAGGWPALVIDACCGGGAIGLTIASAASRAGAQTRVVGIELSEPSCADAEVNAASNGLAEAFTLVRGKVEDRLPDVIAEHAPADSGVTVVVDPPRTGMSPSVCRALRRAHAVTRVIYVSCNPCGRVHRADYVVRGGGLTSNARELLGTRGGGRPFMLAAAAPVDLFAHTPHCELMLRLDRCLQ